MSTLADELLNDFEDSGSEREGEQHDDHVQDSASPPSFALATGYQKVNGDILAAVGAGDDEDEDDEMFDNTGTEDAEDEEETKAKVEKMQLGGVSDVRNVAGLMKTLEPVLEVYLLFFPHLQVLRSPRFTSLVNTALTLPSEPENRPLPGPATRETNHLRWVSRGQPGVSPPHPI